VPNEKRLWSVTFSSTKHSIAPAIPADTTVLVMSDAIKHECGIALIRLRKPYQYYIDKYGTALYGANKLYLLMEKQVNRGQDGAGIANIKIDVPLPFR
jgi:hypothetical protein